jgi:hypothetical protein
MAGVATEWQRLERDLQEGAHEQLVAIGIHLRHLQHQLGRVSRRTERSIRRKHRWAEVPRRDAAGGRRGDSMPTNAGRGCRSAAKSSAGKGKRRPRRVSVTTSLATATRATRPASCFAPRGRLARKREVPRSHSVSGRGGTIRPRTGEPRYFLSLYRRPVRRRCRYHTTAPRRPATEDIKHLH